MMNTAMEQAQTYLIGKSPLVGGILSALIGAGTESVGLVQPGNTYIYVALCGLAGALVASVLRWLIAREQNKITLGRELDTRARRMIEFLQGKVDQHEQVMVLRDELRHDLRSYIDAAFAQVLVLEATIERLNPGYKLPRFQLTPQMVAERVKEVDRAIIDLKQAIPQRDER